MSSSSNTCDILVRAKVETKNSLINASAKDCNDVPRALAVGDYVYDNEVITLTTGSTAPGQFDTGFVVAKRESDQWASAFGISMHQPNSTFVFRVRVTGDTHNSSATMIVPP